MKLSIHLCLCAIRTLASALAIAQADAKALIARQDNQPSSGIDGSGQAVNTNGGASGGSGGGFNLSTGGLVAIIIVVVAVVLFGTATTTLWVIAKRRQWTMKQTLKRASRRLTGRGGPRQDIRDVAEERRRRRTGVQMTSRPEHRGGKREMMVEIKDQEQNGSKAEKSAAAGGPGGPGGGLGSKLWRNDWKR